MVEKELESKEQECPRCKGDGMIEVREICGGVKEGTQCPKCHGTGEVNISTEVES